MVAGFYPALFDYGEAAQVRVAAFYICVALSDPAYVDLTPDYHQDAPVLETGLYQPGQMI
ncbi:hypothetical protein AC578_4231 [Pseudocercospora eumusae]|uniref:Uncharacterized protein n=1 Tax=Pseudocercospora eumusae TaxID=321146 RepID=A0A139H377_9PEZI|nr:hypothetical protein AC578_4231 [Pseudocercospora eumusae]